MMSGPLLFTRLRLGRTQIVVEPVFFVGLNEFSKNLKGILA